MAKEIKSVNVENDQEENYIKAYQSFGWELKSSQRIFNRNSRPVGGVLGAKQGMAISRFYFDKTGKSTQDSYTPDYETINTVLDQWSEDDVIMVGIAHSHEDENPVLSCGDLYYCHRILLSNPLLESFILPVVSHKTGKVNVYVCTLEDGHIKATIEKLKIV